MEHRKLRELATIKFCSITPSRSKMQEDSTKWLVCANFLANNEVENIPTVNNVIPEEEWRLNQNDIVIKRITPTYVNYIDYAPKKIYCGNNLIIVTPNEAIDAKYLAMILNNKIGELSQESSVGAVMKSVSRKDIEAVKVPLPDIEKQRLIGELWYNGIELKKKRTRLAELENIRNNFLIQRMINNESGGITNG